MVFTSAMAEAMCRFDIPKKVAAKSRASKPPRARKPCAARPSPHVLGLPPKAILLKQAPEKLVRAALVRLAQTVPTSPISLKRSSSWPPSACNRRHVEGSSSAQAAKNLPALRRSDSWPTTSAELRNVAARFQGEAGEPRVSKPGFHPGDWRKVTGSEMTLFCGSRGGRCHDVVSGEKHRQVVRQSKRTCRYLRKALRASRVPPALLQARVPSDDELRNSSELIALCNAFSSLLEAGNEEEATPCKGFPNFEALRSNFLRQTLPVLESAGLSAITPAPVSTEVQKRFLSRCNAYGEDSLVLGYHGTPTRNHDSIFQKGLKIPGNGSVPIANGNAHGRGIYLAEAGAHGLSKTFLKGDSDMLVCGVVDNTLPDLEELTDPDRHDTKDAVTPRFVFNGSSLAHRCHRKPSAPAQQLSSQYLGRQLLHAETEQLRHVGSAMVVFHEAHVAPLYVAHMNGAAGTSAGGSWQGNGVVLPPEPQPNRNRDGQVRFAARGQVVDPRSGECCWLAPQEHRCPHGIKVKRVYERRKREDERRTMREHKLQLRGHPSA